MSLLEEWEAGTVYQEQTRTDDGALPGVGTEVAPHPANSGHSIFGVQIVERQIARFESDWRRLAPCVLLSQAGAGKPQRVHACRGKGQATAVAAAEGCATLITSRAYIIRYDLQQGGTPGCNPVCSCTFGVGTYMLHAAHMSVC